MGIVSSGNGKGEIGDGAGIVGCIENGKNCSVRHNNLLAQNENLLPLLKKCMGSPRGSLMLIKALRQSR
jgi:hypothetical protein